MQSRAPGTSSPRAIGGWTRRGDRAAPRPSDRPRTPHALGSAPTFQTAWPLVVSRTFRCPHAPTLASPPSETPLLPALHLGCSTPCGVNRYLSRTWVGEVVRV